MKERHENNWKTLLAVRDARKRAEEEAVAGAVHHRDVGVAGRRNQRAHCAHERNEQHCGFHPELNTHARFSLFQKKKKVGALSKAEDPQAETARP